ncbi:hypothetical protein K466DRAFT_177202 [Polyporus arcularius HHB13444]|uniref:Uncharacterized protein n=1 Tax=Polyporus arcularius HHB13444 TaxID=1314778 RepID=A0A5C3PA27_9APHY|nr:hypothetical protein K466DRAFT_177202 [Polyporus arcularius HHB13444]
MGDLRTAFFHQGRGSTSSPVTALGCRGHRVLHASGCEDIAHIRHPGTVYVVAGAQALIRMSERGQCDRRKSLELTYAADTSGGWLHLRLSLPSVTPAGMSPCPVGWTAGRPCAVSLSSEVRDYGGGRSSRFSMRRHHRDAPGARGTRRGRFREGLHGVNADHDVDSPGRTPARHTAGMNRTTSIHDNVGY